VLQHQQSQLRHDPDPQPAAADSRLQVLQLAASSSVISQQRSRRRGLSIAAPAAS
jgi:hypothetical protein